MEALSALFNVSTVTIRNDLRFLEKSGCAIRGYGGARLNKQFVFDRPLEDKGRINRDIKTASAVAAAVLLQCIRVVLVLRCREPVALAFYLTGGACLFGRFFGLPGGI